jgi:hypothetical protein
MSIPSIDAAIGPADQPDVTFPRFAIVRNSDNACLLE